MPQRATQDKPEEGFWKMEESDGEDFEGTEMLRWGLMVFWEVAIRSSNCVFNFSLILMLTLVGTRVVCILALLLLLCGA